MRYLRIRLLIPIIIIGFVLDGAQAQVSAQDVQPKPSTITGRVTIDGRGASGVVVSLTSTIQGGIFSSMMGYHHPITTKTDKSGYFSFENVGGRYSAEMNVHVYDLEGTYVFINQNRMLRWGIHVTVSPGENITGVDFALTRAAAISGRVLDEKGRGIDGEPVTCLSLDPDESTWREKAMPVKTNSRGHFRFSGLPTGSYRLVFRRTDSNRYLTTYYPNATHETKAFTLEIKAGTEVRDRDIRLSPRPTFTVSGRVIDGQTNQPMPNIPWGIYLKSSQSRSYSYHNDFVGFSGTQGAIHLSGLLPGKYVAYIGNKEGGRDLYCDPVLFEIQGEDVTDVKIKAYRGASISGRAVIEGTADPNTLARITNLRLDILNFSPSSTEFIPIDRRAQIDADGSFRLSGLRPGKMRITGWDFPKGLTLWSVERNGAEQREWVLDMAPEEQLTGVRVVIAHSAGVIRGQIKVEGEESFIGKWLLTLKGVRGAPALHFTDAIDGQGRFTFDGLATGAYTVYAVRFGSDGASSFEYGTNGDQTVTVDNDKETTALIIVKKARAIIMRIFCFGRYREKNLFRQAQEVLCQSTKSLYASQLSFSHFISATRFLLSLERRKRAPAPFRAASR